MRVRILAAAALVLALSGCGGADEAPAADPTTASASLSAGGTAAADANETTELPGEVANADLSKFTCDRDADGTWNADGVLTNPSSSSDYRVTVAVASSGAERTKARRKYVADVRKDSPKSFEVKDVPAGPDAGTCRVQVVRLG